MKVAIIGANGFIGTRLVEMLHLGGQHQVVPVVRRSAALALAARFALESRLGDPLDAASLAAALEGCDAAVHVALGDPRQIEAMPAILCAAAAAAGVPRLVYLSSSSVFGQAPSPGTNDNTPLRSDQPMRYSNSKVRAERCFFERCERHQLVGFALRPGVVLGPRSRWIGDLAKDLRRGEAWLIGEGQGICNSIYVDNLIGAIERCLVAPAPNAGAYIVGDREKVTWSELYHATADALGVSRNTIHRIEPPSDFRLSPRDRFAALIASGPIQAVLPATPARVKQVGKRLLEVLTVKAASPNSWSLDSTPKPRITQEMALLQQCAWQLPIERAQQRLLFNPTVSFQAGLDRSLRWLAFAEGRR